MEERNISKIEIPRRNEATEIKSLHDKAIQLHTLFN